MTIAITTYLIYLAISIALTVWVARTLHKNGRVFLVDVFHGNEALADSVNHLLVVGFYPATSRPSDLMHSPPFRRHDDAGANSSL